MKLMILLMLFGTVESYSQVNHFVMNQKDKSSINSREEKVYMAAGFKISEIDQIMLIRQDIMNDSSIALCKWEEEEKKRVKSVLSKERFQQYLYLKEEDAKQSRDLQVSNIKMLYDYLNLSNEQVERILAYEIEKENRVHERSEELSFLENQSELKKLMNDILTKEQCSKFLIEQKKEKDLFIEQVQQSDRENDTWKEFKIYVDYDTENYVPKLKLLKKKFLSDIDPNDKRLLLELRNQYDSLLILLGKEKYSYLKKKYQDIPVYNEKRGIELDLKDFAQVPNYFVIKQQFNNGDKLLETLKVIRSKYRHLIQQDEELMSLRVQRRNFISETKQQQLEKVMSIANPPFPLFESDIDEEERELSEDIEFLLL